MTLRGRLGRLEAAIPPVFAPDPEAERSLALHAWLARITNEEPGAAAAHADWLMRCAEVCQAHRWGAEGFAEATVADAEANRLAHAFFALVADYCERTGDRPPD